MEIGRSVTKKIVLRGWTLTPLFSDAKSGNCMQMRDKIEKKRPSSNVYVSDCSVSVRVQHWLRFFWKTKTKMRNWVKEAVLTNKKACLAFPYLHPGRPANY